MAIRTRTERFEYLKDKRTVLLYGEEVRGDRPPMMEGHKLYIPKYVFNGKIPSIVNLTIDWDDEK